MRSLAEVAKENGTKFTVIFSRNDSITAIGHFNKWPEIRNYLRKYEGQHFIFKPAGYLSATYSGIVSIQNVWEAYKTHLLGHCFKAKYDMGDVPKGFLVTVNSVYYGDKQLVGVSRLNWRFNADEFFHLFEPVI